MTTAVALTPMAPVAPAPKFASHEAGVTFRITFPTVPASIVLLTYVPAETLSTLQVTIYSLLFLCFLNHKR